MTTNNPAKAYVKTAVQARQAYLEATAPKWQAYLEARKLADETFKEVITQAAKALQEATALAEAMAAFDDKK